MLFWQNRFSGLELQVKISPVNNDAILDFYLLVYKRAMEEQNWHQLAIPFVLLR